MPSERDLAFMCVKYRRDNHLTVSEAANKIGVSYNTLMEIEKERPVTKRIFLKVYETLKEKGVEL